MKEGPVGGGSEDNCGRVGFMRVRMMTVIVGMVTRKASMWWGSYNHVVDIY